MRPNPSRTEDDEAEFGVGGRERVVNFNRLLCGGSRLRKKFVWRQVSGERREVSVGEAGVGERVRGIAIPTSGIEAPQTLTCCPPSIFPKRGRAASRAWGTGGM